MGRRTISRAALATVLSTSALSLAAARGDAAPAAALAPSASARAFGDYVDRVRVGLPVPLGRSVVLFLWLAPDPGHPAAAPDAWVGLDGSSATITDLPAPVGDAAVRIVNGLDVALYVPRGEALVANPGAGEPRIVDRPVWIPARSAAYVPVAQPRPVVAQPPYRPVADRASPETLRALRAERWATSLPGENHALGVPSPREADALAGYESAPFARVEAAWMPALEAARATLPGPAVGLATIDPMGLATIVLEGDPGRFRALWPSLARGACRDAAVREASNAPPVTPRAAAKAVEEAVAAVDELRAEPMVRPAFGRGDQLRWPDVPAPARWIGLAVDGRPVSATYHRLVDPQDAPGAPPPGGPPQPPPPTPPPGQTELDRREPRTPFEERYHDRREGMN